MKEQTLLGIQPSSMLLLVLFQQSHPEFSNLLQTSLDGSDIDSEFLRDFFVHVTFHLENSDLLSGLVGQCRQQLVRLVGEDGRDIR